MSSKKEEAIALLKDTSYFYDASEDLLEAFAGKMIPIEAKPGKMFVQEGDPITQMLILEEGTLIRTKLSVEEEAMLDMKTSFRRMSLHFRQKSLTVNSVTIDRIKGRGRISGLLHSCEGNSEAFATVSADTDVKVWILRSDDFRDIITENPKFSLEILRSMAREVRSGSKSVRQLVRKARGIAIGKEISKKNLIRVLSYDTSAWVSDGFKPAVQAFNTKQKEEKGESGVYIEMDYTTDRLSERSATHAAGYDAVCLFVNDDASERVLRTLSLMGVGMIAMRCAGFDKVDTKAATAFQLTVARVPAYSPYAVAEFAVTLLMAVNRRIARAAIRVAMTNFTVDAGLMGMDVHGKTVGIMGTGKIGRILCKIMLGFGVNLLCYDIFESEEVKQAGGKYVSKEELFGQSDIIFLMMPLLKTTHHIINAEAIGQMKKGVILINTSRGGLIDTKALLAGVQDEIIAGAGLDVYEHEGPFFFQDWSARNIKDPDLQALIGNNKILLTAHQAFFTKEAVGNIVDTTLNNIADYKLGMRGQAHPNNCLPKMN